MTTRAADSALGRGRLRSELRNAREQAGLTQQEVADDLEWSLSKVVRIESGHVGISKTDLKAILGTYRRDGDEAYVTEMLRLAAVSRHQWWSKYRDFLNPDYVAYLGYLDAAVKVSEFQLAAVPGALQCQAYAGLLIGSLSVGVEPELVERKIEARLAREEIFSRSDCPEMEFVIAEAALRSYVGRPGDRAVQRKQLEHLIDMSHHPKLSIRMLPFSFGSHGALAGGFVLLELGQDGGNILFRETARPALTVDDPTRIDDYSKIFAELLAGSTDIEPAAKSIIHEMDR